MNNVDPLVSEHLGKSWTLEPGWNAVGTTGGQLAGGVIVPARLVLRFKDFTRMFDVIMA